jgi:hypothetical protein
MVAWEATALPLGYTRVIGGNFTMLDKLKKTWLEERLFISERHI